MPRPYRLAVAMAVLSIPSLAHRTHAQQAAPPASSARVAPVAAVPAPTAEAMRRLAWLEGEWEGTGWIVMGRERFTFQQRERAHAVAGGAALVIDGQGTSTDAGKEGTVIHQAFAVISWDPSRGAYRMRAWRANGEETEDQPAITEGGFTWHVPAPGGRVRFTEQLTAAGEWHEVGDYLRAGEADDAKGARFFEMTLRRK